MARNGVSALLLLFCVMAMASLSTCDVYTPGFEVSEAESKGGHVSKGCPLDFSKVSFADVTSVCKGPQYSQAQCCAAFKKMACKFSPQVNDFSTTCPVEFMAYLNYAGSYPNGVFVGRCNSGNNLCE